MNILESQMNVQRPKRTPTPTKLKAKADAVSISAASEQEFNIQLNDKLGKHCVYLNVNNYSYIGFNTPYHIYMNYFSSIKDLKKEYFEKLEEYNRNIFIFSDSIIKTTKISNTFGHITDEKIKIRDFNCVNIRFNIDFPQLVCLKFMSHQHQLISFVFESQEIISSAIKFIKKQIDFDISRLYYNKQPIPANGTLHNFFRIGVNELTAIQTENIKNSENSMEFGSIYLIQTREYKSLQKNIYKIGKTENDIDTRLGNYGKGGQVFYTIAVPKSELTTFEQNLINNFKSKFTQRCDIGTEYFEGKFLEMIYEIHQHAFKILMKHN